MFVNRKTNSLAQLVSFNKSSCDIIDICCARTITSRYRSSVITLPTVSLKVPSSIPIFLDLLKADHSANSSECSNINVLVLCLICYG